MLYRKLSINIEFTDEQAEGDQLRFEILRILVGMAASVCSEEIKLSLGSSGKLLDSEKKRIGWWGIEGEL